MAIINIRDVTLSKEQQNAHDQIINWLFDPGQKNWFSVTGSAGTGKTTLVAKIAQALQNTNDFNKELIFLTLTGKASRVLRTKLNDLSLKARVSTIHSFIYRLLEKKDDELIFELDESKLASLRDKAQDYFLILDETSMIPQSIFRDLKELNTLMICAGDIGQLPAVKGKRCEPILYPDITLKEIHRQALENPIIRMANNIRQGEPVPFKVWEGKVGRFSFKETRRLNPIRSDFFTGIHENNDRVCLCSTNQVRVRNNNEARRKNGFTSSQPQAGERLICLQNNKKHQIFNGEIFFVKHCEVLKEGFLYKMTLLDEEKIRELELPVYAPGFNSANHKDLTDMLEAESKKEVQKLTGIKTSVKRSLLHDIGIFDFGYSLTVHKSQGSEWQSVLAYVSPLRSMTDEDYKKLAYTAVTRASDKLLLVCDDLP